MRKVLKLGRWCSCDGPNLSTEVEMTIDLTAPQARLLKAKLMNAPVAPGELAPIINVGTDRMLDVLDEQYSNANSPKVSPGGAVPDEVRHQVERPFVTPWLGAPDAQMASALMGLGKRLTALESASAQSAGDQELIGWTRREYPI